MKFVVLELPYLREGCSQMCIVYHSLLSFYLTPPPLDYLSWGREKTHKIKVDECIE